jgi:hypothetical protein
MTGEGEGLDCRALLAMTSYDEGVASAAPFFEGFDNF